MRNHLISCACALGRAHGVCAGPCTWRVRTWRVRVVTAGCVTVTMEDTVATASLIMQAGLVLRASCATAAACSDG